MRDWMVWKLVRVPPSQRVVTNGMPQRRASVSIASWAWRLVPTKRIGAAVGDEVPREVAGVLEEVDGLLEVQDVDPVALREDVLAHLRVPAACLVPEMHACFQQGFHRDRCSQRVVAPFFSVRTNSIRGDGQLGTTPPGWLSRPLDAAKHLLNYSHPIRRVASLCPYTNTAAARATSSSSSRAFQRRRSRSASSAAPAPAG